MDSIDKYKARLDAEMQFLTEPLFESKMKPNPDSALNASLSTWGDGWDVYAEGYKNAADILVDNLGKAGYRNAADIPIDESSNEWKAYPDLLVYPIVFLYRHYLELRLKELLFVSSRLLDQPIKPMKTHNLLLIWRKVRPNVERVWDSPESKAASDAIEQRLTEMCLVDIGSYAWRYPQDNDGSPSLPGVNNVNLGHLKNVVQAISNVLDGSSTGMGEYLQTKNEMEADMRTEYAAEMRQMAAEAEAEMRAEYEAEMRAEYADEMRQYNEY